MKNFTRSATQIVVVFGVFLGSAAGALFATPTVAAHDCQELPPWPNDPHDPPGCGPCDEGEHDHEYGAAGVGINRCSSAPTVAVRQEVEPLS